MLYQLTWCTPQYRCESLPTPHESGQRTNGVVYAIYSTLRHAAAEEKCTEALCGQDRSSHQKKCLDMSHFEVIFILQIYRLVYLPFLVKDLQLITRYLVTSTLIVAALGSTSKIPELPASQADRQIRPPQGVKSTPKT